MWYIWIQRNSYETTALLTRFYNFPRSYCHTSPTADCTTPTHFCWRARKFLARVHFSTVGRPTSSLDRQASVFMERREAAATESCTVIALVQPVEDSSCLQCLIATSIHSSVCLAPRRNNRIVVIETKLNNHNVYSLETGCKARMN